MAMCVLQRGTADQVVANPGAVTLGMRQRMNKTLRAVVGVAIDDQDALAQDELIDSPQAAAESTRRTPPDGAPCRALVGGRSHRPLRR
jgi:hypothetical protein